MVLTRPLVRLTVRRRLPSPTTSVPKKSTREEMLEVNWPGTPSAVPQVEPATVHT